MKKMRQKIAILLLALCATSTVNAQTGGMRLIPAGPKKVSKYNQAEKAEDICGIYYWKWGYKTTQPTANADAPDVTGTSTIAITLLSEEDNTVQIWGIFQKPITATFSIVATTGARRLTIPAGSNAQVVETTDDGEDIVLKGGGFSSNSYTNGWTNIVFTFGSNYLYSSYWLDPCYSSTGESVGKFYHYSTTYNYWLSSQSYPDETYNAVMYIKWGAGYQAFPVSVTQSGNRVQVQNFLNWGKTVNVDLHADNTFSIEPQVVRTSNDVDYTLYPINDGVVDKNNPLVRQGTEQELSLGDYRYQAESGSGVTFSIGRIIMTKPNVAQFRYPVALTMTDAGWASFSSEKALDFTGTGLTPYAVSEVDATNGATLSPVEVAVAPHTGLFVSGVADNYEIPTVADGNTLPANALVATSQGEHTSDGQTYWGLGLDANSGEIGLKKMSAGSVAANKAYLIFDRAAAGAKSFLPFNFGGTTAIEGSLTPNPSPEGKGSLYNLQGQRVGEGYRGIVIKNGKKVVKH